LLAQPAYNEGPSDDDNRRQHDNEKHNSGSTHLSSSQISKLAKSTSTGCFTRAATAGEPPTIRSMLKAHSAIASSRASGVGWKRC